MFKPLTQTPPPNHKCANCGREFFNRPSDQGGNSICFRCGDEAEHGEEAGMYTPFDASMTDDNTLIDP